MQKLIGYLKKHYIDGFYTNTGELCDYSLIIQKLKEIAFQHFVASKLLFKYHSDNHSHYLATTLYRVYELIVNKLAYISSKLTKTLPPKLYLTRLTLTER